MKARQIFGLLIPSGGFVEEYPVIAPVKINKGLKIPHVALALLIC